MQKVAIKIILSVLVLIIFPFTANAQEDITTEQGMTFGFVMFFLLIGIGVFASFYRKISIAIVYGKIRKIAQADIYWDESYLHKRIKDIFCSYQNDWSNKNFAAMKEYLCPALYQKIFLEQSILEKLQRKNLIENVKVNRVTITHINHDTINANNDNFTAEINATIDDSLIDMRNNCNIYSNHDIVTNFWNFTRSGNDWKLNEIRRTTPSFVNLEINTRQNFSPDKDIIYFAKKYNFYYDIDFGKLTIPDSGVFSNKGTRLRASVNNHAMGIYEGEIVQVYKYNSGPKTIEFKVVQIILPKFYNHIVVRSEYGVFEPLLHDFHQIMTESNAFNEKYNVWVDNRDKINSLELLSPNFMEALLNLPFYLNIEVVGNFLCIYSSSTRVSYDKMLEILIWANRIMKK